MFRKYSLRCWPRLGNKVTSRLKHARNRPRSWEATTKDLPAQDRMIHIMQMGMNLFTANLHFDSEGRFIRSVQPGGVAWVNPQTMSGAFRDNLGSFGE